MPTLLLASSDNELIGRVCKSLRPGERLSVARLAGDASVVAMIDNPELAAIDGRGMARKDMIRACASLRDAVAAETRIVVIGSFEIVKWVEVIRRATRVDLDVLLQAHDQIELLLRALLNDASQTVSAVNALRAGMDCLKPRALEVAAEVLTGGCRASTVKQIAHCRCISPETVQAALAAEGSPPPKLVIRLARCCYGAALLRRGVAWAEIRRLTRYGNVRTVKAHMGDTLGRDFNVWPFFGDDQVFESALSSRALGWLARQAPAKTRRGPSRPVAVKAGRQAGRQVSLPATFKEAA